MQRYIIHLRMLNVTLFLIIRLILNVYANTKKSERPSITEAVALHAEVYNPFENVKCYPFPHNQINFECLCQHQEEWETIYYRNRNCVDPFCHIEFHQT